MNALCEAVKTYGPLAGRLLLALIFVISGYGKLVGGVLLVIGWQTRWAATAIFLFMIPTTLIFHAFWAAAAANQQMETIQFMKNLCIMGGMLYVMAFGAGPYSIDNRKR